uniref:JmjC domain-containing protein n=1 Tax=Arcella intermedia TaxID=1963864 RepID=A0A6B2L6H6_9EUKA
MPYVAKLTSMREPFVLTDTVFTTWRLARMANASQYLAGHPSFALLKNVKVSRRATMTDCNASMALPGAEARPSFDLREMTGEALFEKLADPKEEEKHYYYAKVDEDLKRDLQPNDFLWVSEDDKVANELYVWVSGTGIGPSVHYDMDHNIFTQAWGRKRFLLFPPWESKNLYPNPRIHPCNRKGQVDFDEPDLKRYPNLLKAKGYIADLKAGDVLYIPPFWWHKVYSLSPSISFSALSNSGIYHKLSGLYQHTFLFDHLEEEKKLGAILNFLKGLLEKIYGDGAVGFVKEMLESRWERLSLSEEEDSLGGYMEERIKLDFGSDIEFAVSILKSCQTLYGQDVDPNRQDIKAISSLELADFIEIILANAIGPQKVFPTLKSFYQMIQ